MLVTEGIQNEIGGTIIHQTHKLQSPLSNHIKVLYKPLILYLYRMWSWFPLHLREPKQGCIFYIALKYDIITISTRSRGRKSTEIQLVEYTSDISRSQNTQLFNRSASRLQHLPDYVKLAVMSFLQNSRERKVTHAECTGVETSNMKYTCFYVRRQYITLLT